MILYLSGTGNSRWAAEYLSAETGERLIPILDAGVASRITLAKDERIGFVFPVHGWRPPKIMRRFISELTVENFKGHYSYAVVTAGDNIGETISIFEDDLKKRGMRLDAAFSLIMPESYVGLPFMDVDTLDNEKRKITASEKRLERYAEAINSRRCLKSELDIGKWPRINSRVIGGYFNSRMITDKPFRVTADKCIGCGLCAKVCPTNDIEIGEDKRPVWKHNGDCMSCFSCYHHCPQHAIEYGNRTKNKGQYYFGKNLGIKNKNKK